MNTELSTEMDGSENWRRHNRALHQMHGELLNEMKNDIVRTEGRDIRATKFVHIAERYCHEYARARQIDLPVALRTHMSKFAIKQGAFIFFAKFLAPNLQQGHKEVGAGASLERDVAYIVEMMDLFYFDDELLRNMGAEIYQNMHTDVVNAVIEQYYEDLRQHNTRVREYNAHASPRTVSRKKKTTSKKKRAKKTPKAKPRSRRRTTRR